MAKKESLATEAPSGGSTKGAKGPAMNEEVPWQVHDAYHTLRRAQGVLTDGKLMAQVKKHAKHMETEARMATHHIGMLARQGKISDRYMAKLPRSNERAAGEFSRPSQMLKAPHHAPKGDTASRKKLDKMESLA